MSARHTPAPWRLNGCELIADSTVIATIHWHTGRDAENAADGALMQAAPLLLEALELADAVLRGANMDRRVVERKVTAAIAKARGQSPLPLDPSLSNKNVGG